MKNRESNIKEIEEEVKNIVDKQCEIIGDISIQYTLEDEEKKMKLIGLRKIVIDGVESAQMILTQQETEYLAKLLIDKMNVEKGLKEILDSRVIKKINGNDAVEILKQQLKEDEKRILEITREYELKKEERTRKWEILENAKKNHAKILQNQQLVIRSNTILNKLQLLFKFKKAISKKQNDEIRSKLEELRDIESDFISSLGVSTYEEAEKKLYLEATVELYDSNTGNPYRSYTMDDLIGKKNLNINNIKQQISEREDIIGLINGSMHEQVYDSLTKIAVNNLKVMYSNETKAENFINKFNTEE